MKNLLLTFIIVPLLLTTCYREDEDTHYFIHFGNRSRQAIYVTANTFRGDTIPVEYETPPDAHTYKIDPGKINTDALFSGISWEDSFGDSYVLPNDTLSVFVFDALKMEDKQSSSRDALLVRYDLVLRDLQQLNWIVMYPPTRNMKSIKMWPPYTRWQ